MVVTELTAAEAKRAEVVGLQWNVFALGWVSFFDGLSQDMILPALPLFPGVMALPAGVIAGLL